VEMKTKDGRAVNMHTCKHDSGRAQLRAAPGFGVDSSVSGNAFAPTLFFYMSCSPNRVGCPHLPPMETAYTAVCSIGRSVLDILPLHRAWGWRRTFTPLHYKGVMQSKVAGADRARAGDQPCLYKMPCFKDTSQFSLPLLAEICHVHM
jgi:hypothetical protein